METLVLLVFLELALALELQGAVLDADVDVFLIYSRNIGFQD